MDLSPVEMRILGCLLEKQRTTPDTYPLSLNALRLACNQSTNRDPVVNYDEHTIREALDHLTRRGYARLASGAGSRVGKYRHLLAENLRIDEAEQAVLGVLMLRGPQTIGEIKLRTERWHQFSDLDEVELTLEALGEREFVANVGRRPGQKEDRFAQLIGEADTQAYEPHVEAAPYVSPLEQRIAQLEREVAALLAAMPHVVVAAVEDEAPQDEPEVVAAEPYETPEEPGFQAPPSY